MTPAITRGTPTGWIVAVVCAVAFGAGVHAAQPAPAPTAYTALTQALTTAAAAAPALVHVTTVGTSVEQRAIPLVVIAPNLPDAAAASVRAAGKLRVWIRAGTHGDAAEGTEAALALIRDLAAGRHAEWLGSLVLIITPLANPDGHERVSPAHLGRRNGPAGGTGQRVNAANVDIEHDYVRLDSPESRALLEVFTSYDPQALIDLDTGDNACSGDAVAYRASLHPNISERLAALARSDWGPFAAQNVRQKYALNAGPEGRLDVEGTCGLPGVTPAPAPAPVRASGPGRRGASPSPAAPPAGRAAATPARGRGGDRGNTPAGGDGGAGAAPASPPLPTQSWTSLPDAPRSFATYFGLRNRIVLTGVTDGFLGFADRVTAATRFLEEAVAFAYGASTRFEKAVEATDPELMVGTTLAMDWRPMLTGSTPIEVTPASVTPVAGSAAFSRAAGSPVQAMDRTSLQADATETMAAEYYVPEEATAVLDVLRKHGIQLRQLTQSTRGVEQFASTGTALVADVDGHAMRKLTGNWQAAPGVVVPTGTWVVRMNQRLARVAFTLLEPASNDGLVAWNVVNSTAAPYPILRKR